MIKKLLFLLVGFSLVGGVPWIIYLYDAVGESEPIVESTGVTITVTTPEPIQDEAILAGMAIRWMTEARDSHQRAIDNWTVGTPWVNLDNEREWVRRYDVTLGLLEKQR